MLYDEKVHYYVTPRKGTLVYLSVITPGMNISEKELNSKKGYACAELNYLINNMLPYGYYLGKVLLKSAITNTHILWVTVPSCSITCLRMIFFINFLLIFCRRTYPVYFRKDTYPVGDYRSSFIYFKNGNTIYFACVSFLNIFLFVL